jgi:RNA polymerase sigma-70 factor (ECF subfamily)
MLEMEPAVTTTSATVVSADLDLVRRAGRGDLGAVERLVELRADRLHRTATAILGDDAEAADATQEAFVSAWRALPRLREPERFDAWLQRILINGCRSRLRGRRRVASVPLDDAFEQRQPGPSLSDQVADTDLLAHAFERLDAAKRSLLVLHYLEHQPVGAIADALGIPSGTVKSRLSDARAALSRALTAEGEARR